MARRVQCIYVQAGSVQQQQQQNIPWRRHGI